MLDIETQEADLQTLETLDSLETLEGADEALAGGVDLAPLQTPLVMTAAAEAALSALHAQMGDAIARIAHACGCDDEGADEVTQETWLTIVRWWPRLYVQQPPEQWQACVVRAAQSRARDWLRKLSRRAGRVRPLAPLPAAGAADGGALGGSGETPDEYARYHLAALVGADGPAPSDPAQMAEGRETWAQALGACRTDRERFIVTLRGEAFTSDEIAWALAEAGGGQMSANAIDLALSRVRSRARLALA